MILIEGLQSHENVQFEAGATVRALIPAVLATIILGMIPIVGWFLLGPFFALWTLWNLFSNIRSRSYSVTTQRIITQKKFFRLNQKTIPLQNVSDIRIHQGIFGRLLDFGHVSPVPMSGVADPALTLRNVRNPRAVSETINNLVRMRQTK